MNQIDLNLLQTFDALFELRSTTRAAERLGLTQSAVSHALRRLREAVGDPLFVRAGRALQPTARAIEMAPDIHAGLVQLRGALAPSDFDPATVERTITLSAGSYVCSLFAPQLIAWAREAAPGIIFRLVPLESDLPALLEAGSVDMAIGLFEQVPDRFVTEPILSDEFAWVAASNHPLAGRPVSRAEIDAYPNLQIGIVHPFGLPSAVLEIRQISEVPGLQGTQMRTPDAIVYEGATAIAAVAASNMVARVPRRLVDHFGPVLGAIALDARAPGIEFTLSALWHGRLRHDAALRWLLDRVHAIC